MNGSEGHCVSSRRPTLPSISNRTLHHPSFLPLYMTADFALHHTVCDDQPIHPIIPAEFFYSDPTMSCGTRIPNIVTELRVFDCFQLSTPPPIMSACMAPPSSSRSIQIWTTPHHGSGQLHL
uniref:histone deacetylase complex subunit SAP25-like isoform X7 n=1 Tax=Scatophagus argus TaxID=75038 RepID=UPI001ED7E903|nr:histone deacetylase complex subunit SAP25-like isoform X7 [Scatophagus argus]